MRCANRNGRVQLTSLTQIVSSLPTKHVLVVRRATQSTQNLSARVRLRPEAWSTPVRLSQASHERTTTTLPEPAQGDVRMQAEHAGYEKEIPGEHGGHGCRKTKQRAGKRKLMTHKTPVDVVESHHLPLRWRET